MIFEDVWISNRNGYTFEGGMCVCVRGGGGGGGMCVCVRGVGRGAGTTLIVVCSILKRGIYSKRKLNANTEIKLFSLGEDTLLEGNGCAGSMQEVKHVFFLLKNCGDTNW